MRMGSPGPNERRDLPAAQGQIVGGDLSSAETPTAQDFDTLFAAIAHSPTLRRIWHDAYGRDYPEEADPFSFVTLTDLRRMAAELAVGPGQVVVDLACGRGGPGLWVAQETGASLIGVDFSEVGIEQAERRALELGFGERARFLVRDAAATGLPEASFDGAMSVDSFWLFPDKRRVAAEIARILRPGARFIFTTWELPASPAGWPPQLNQHRDLLSEAGLALRACAETQDWRRRQLAVYEGILAAESSLRAELGEDATAPLIGEALEVPDLLQDGRRVLIVSTRP
jgi:SAM-dependent methyltransferase